MRIAVLGAGSWGTTLSNLLHDNSHAVTLWSYKEEHARELESSRENRLFLPGISIRDGIDITHDIESAIRHAEAIVAAVPAQYLRAVLLQFPSPPPTGTIIVNVAKGVENDTLLTMSGLIRTVFPGISESGIATLSGPSHAEEVSRKIPTTVVAASNVGGTAGTVRSLFMTPTFRVYESTDLLGVEIGGALKNVIAIAAGIIDGANLGDNTKAALMTRGIAEIARIGVAMGAHVRTFGGLSGIGDLMVTCMSRHSRNRFVGVEIGKGRSLEDILAGMIMVAEGIETARSAHALAMHVGVEAPIIDQVYKILFERKDPLVACHELMTRDPKGE